MPSVAYQGIPGANSEIAVRQHFGPDAVCLPCQDFSLLFEAVKSKEVEYCLLPIENSYTGQVFGSYDLLMVHDLQIQAEAILHVHHALLGISDTTMDDIKQVRSHPQALMQCKKYLEKHGLEPVEWYDTAGAARDLADDKARPREIGVIATELAGKLYKLEILDKLIEDEPYNYTRFLLLGHGDPEPSDYNKTSIVFATRNQPAALYQCLGEFAKRDLNLTKLESRPRRDRPWEPLFYLDFEGHWQDPKCQAVLTQLLHLTSFLKMLGSYPAVQSGTVGM